MSRLYQAGASSQLTEIVTTENQGKQIAWSSPFLLSSLPGDNTGSHWSWTINILILSKVALSSNWDERKHKQQRKDKQIKIKILQHLQIIQTNK